MRPKKLLKPLDHAKAYIDKTFPLELAPNLENTLLRAYLAGWSKAVDQRHVKPLDRKREKQNEKNGPSY